MRLVLRLVVMGIGLGVVTGTSLKLLAPRLAEGASKSLSLDLGANRNKKGLDPGQFEPRTELAAMSQRWSKLASAQKDLSASAFLLVLDDGRYAQLQPTYHCLPPVQSKLRSCWQGWKTSTTASCAGTNPCPSPKS